MPTKLQKTDKMDDAAAKAGMSPLTTPISDALDDTYL
jgi:hypothetical protein